MTSIHQKESRQPPEWEKIYTSDLGFISTIYTVNSNNPINECANEMISQF